MVHRSGQLVIALALLHASSIGAWSHGTAQTTAVEPEALVERLVAASDSERSTMLERGDVATAEARERSSRSRQGAARSRVVESRQLVGSLDEAILQLEELMAIFEELGERRVAALVTDNAGSVHH